MYKLTGLSRKFMYSELIMVFWSLIMFSFIIIISDVYPAPVTVEIIINDVYPAPVTVGIIINN